MENTGNRETAEEIERKKEFHRVMENIGNLPKPNEAGPSTSSSRQPQHEENRIKSETPEIAETKIMSD